MSDDATPVEGLPNLGPASARWLQAVGIDTRGGLFAAGSVAAFLKVRAAGFRPSLNLLYALEGAITGTHWAELPAEAKVRLNRAVTAE